MSEPGLTKPNLLIRPKPNIVNIHLTNPDWKPHLDLLKVFDVSLEMSGDPKNYFGFT